MSKRYLTPNEHIDHLERSVRKHKADKVQLQAELDTARKDNKRLQDEIRARRQWQTCPSCNRAFATQS